MSLQFRDNGVGIPREELDHVFEPFLTTKADGVGLGLAICKTIIEEHEGRISIQSFHESNGMNGTVVTVAIPGYDVRKSDKQSY